MPNRGRVALSHHYAVFRMIIHLRYSVGGVWSTARFTSAAACRIGASAVTVARGPSVTQNRQLRHLLNGVRAMMSAATRSAAHWAIRRSAVWAPGPEGWRPCEGGIVQVFVLGSVS